MKNERVSYQNSLLIQILASCIISIWYTVFGEYWTFNVFISFIMMLYVFFCVFLSLYYVPKSNHSTTKETTQ